MKQRIHSYTVVDVETANRKNNTICSIGLVQVVDGFVVDEVYSLVNPEDYFDMDNIAIHGITPNMVAGAPTFGELYPKIKHLLERTIVVAHNAPFDLSVLRRNMLRYGIGTHEFCYVCTVVQGRKAFPELKRHNLAAMSHYLDVDLEQHHNALWDAKAAQGIFENIQSRRSLGPKELRTYHLKDEPVLMITPEHLAPIVRDLENVFARVDFLEALRDWYDDYQIFQDAYPLSNFLSLTESVLQDGIVTPTEDQILRHWFLELKKFLRLNSRKKEI